jgi:hypothetical protein
MSFVDPINVPLIVFSSNALNSGFSPTVAITICNENNIEVIYETFPLEKTKKNNR